MRPEDVRISNDGELRFNVSGIERLGGDAIYHLEAGGNWIKALWHRSGGGLTSADEEEHGQLNVTLAVPSAVIFKE